MTLKFVTALEWPHKLYCILQLCFQVSQKELNNLLAKTTKLKLPKPREHFE